MTMRESARLLTNQLSTIYEHGEAVAITDWVFNHLAGANMTNKHDWLLKKISPEQLARLEEITKRLLLNEPVQYVLNESWFCGLKLYVDKHVLIPRPETEELVEWIISDCKFPVASLSILDIGSGSGCIPIALKRRLRKAEVWSCDISAAALKVAKRNADNLGTEVNFVRLDFLNADHRSQLPSFDIIVSNPPYVPHANRQQMLANVLDYEPATALFVPDGDPLIFYRDIAAFGKSKLNPGGAIYTEIHKDHGQSCKKLFEYAGYSVELRKDMQGNDRMLKANFGSPG